MKKIYAFLLIFFFVLACVDSEKIKECKEQSDGSRVCGASANDQILETPNNPVADLCDSTTGDVLSDCKDEQGQDVENIDNLPLFFIDDIEYLGAFKIPGGDFGESSANYSNGALAYNSDNHSLFISSIYNHSIAEFKIPDISLSMNLDELKTATNLQGFVKILNRGVVTQGTENDTITGMYYKQNKLMVNSEIWYDNSSNPNSTLVIQESDKLASSTVSGYYKVTGDVSVASHAAGYITDVPSVWQKIIGSKHIMGWASNYSINSRYSIGPSIFSFNIEDVLRSNRLLSEGVNLKVWMNFPYSYDGEMQLTPSGNDVSAPVSEDTALWNVLSRGMIGFIVPGSKTFAVFGYSGGFEAGISYKTPTDGRSCPGSCPNREDDKANYYWFFNLDDILNAKKVYDPRPYAFGKISVPFDDHGSHQISGASFDPIDKTLYLSLYGATSEITPVIATFRVSK